MPAWRCESAEEFAAPPAHALALDVPSLIVVPIDYSIDVAISEELGRRPSHMSERDRGMSADDRGKSVRLDAVPKQLWIGGEWRDGSGATSSPSRTPRPARRSREVADGTRRRRQGRARRRARGAGGVGRARRRNERARDPAPKAYETLTERADDLALLMTLEMGKTVTESKGEITYAAEFFAGSPGGAAHRRLLQDRAATASGRVLVHAPADRALPDDHALELPHGHGHAQDRPGGRGRLHDGDQAGAADPAVDARAGRDPARVRACRPAC